MQHSTFVQTSNKEELLSRLDLEVINLNHVLELLNQIPWADENDLAQSRHAAKVEHCLALYGDVIFTSKLLNNGPVEVPELKHLLALVTATRRTLEITVKIL